MRRVRTAFWIVLAVLVACGPAALAARAANGGVQIAADRTAIATKLGRPFGFRTAITNAGATAAPGLIAHLNVLSLRDGTYVDPEDWSSNRTRYLAMIPVGGSTTIPWQLHAVNAGRFAVYVALVRSDGTALPAVSPPVRVTVTDRRTLNSAGILPLAIGIPMLLGLVWGLVRLSRSRGTRRDTGIRHHPFSEA